MSQFSKLNKNPGGGTRPPKEGDGIRSYLPWRYENKDNLATKEVRGSTMRWCKNDCHDRPMWCGRRNCLGRSDYATAMQKNKDKGDESSGGGQSNFKIALAAMTTLEDFQALQEQFSDLKE